MPILSAHQIKELNKLLKYNPLILNIINKISHESGKIFLVGGAVRDLLLNLPVKDLDIEVHNLELEKLEQILKQFGPVSLTGKVFGVLRVHGLDIDWSLPRKDTSGRKPEVKIDPHMSIKNAFARRDLTINAMGIDLITKELVDPFNGYKDLQNKILRATDINFFVEDPLRFYRVMQFIGRFEMEPDKELNNICKKMDIKSVSVERIDQEFRKLFLKSVRPSLGINWLKNIERLKEIMPELFATISIEQNPKWHPEGDVYTHTMQALDAAASQHYHDANEKIIIMWAALCHDLGKVTKTKIVDGKIISHGHEIDSAVLAKKLLKRITRDKHLISCVVKLVRYHMMPGQFVSQNSKASAYKKLANKLAPEVNMQMLSKLFFADRAGRNPDKTGPLTGPLPDVQEFKKKTEQLNIANEPEKPVLQGKDLMGVITPGPEMGKLLKKAYRIQIEKNVQDKEILKSLILKPKS